MSVTLKNGSGSMPLVGLGCWKIPNESAPQQVYEAIKAGYRLLDGAADYGNENECGLGLKKAIDEGIVKREDVFVTSKLWGTFHRKEHVEEACRRSLKDWGLDHFDLYLIHFPLPQKFEPFDGEYPPTFYTRAGKRREMDNVPYQETWKAMEQLKEKGLVRNIGVSNVNVMMIMDVLRYATNKPAVLQIEHHPYLAQPLLVDYCNSNGIAITAYSSFGVQSYLELGVKDKLPPLMEHETIVKIAKAHNKTPAQILLRWATQRNVAVIPKSSNPTRLAQNLDCTSWNLTEQDIAEIAKLDQNIRYNDPKNYFGVPIFA